jgi:hypothetical protein
VLWIIVDIVLALLTLVLLGVGALRLWRRFKALGRALGRLGDVTSQLPRPGDQPASSGRHL